MDRVEVGTWGREEGCLRLSPMSPPGTVQEPCALGGSIGLGVVQAQAAKEGCFGHVAWKSLWDESVALCDRLEGRHQGEMYLRSCPRPRGPRQEVT